MDIKQHNQQLYDAQSLNFNKAEDAIKKRNEGPSFQLKEFHNKIKRALITHFAQNKSRILDIGCGRGGDISKWTEAHVLFVKGIDSSSNSIEEYKHRYEGFRRSYKFTLDLEVCDNLSWTADEPYDCVSAMFSLQYFFQSQLILLTMLQDVYRHLKFGGVFFGCVPSARRILQLLQKQDSYASPMLTVHKLFESKPACYGSPVSVCIGDTVVEDGSHEFLVFESALTRAAIKCGFQPVTAYQFPSLIETNNEVFKCFTPHFVPDTDPNLTLASGLFCTFAFSKPNLKKRKQHATQVEKSKVSEDVTVS
jgi:mRNA (guanine-N7-)-methyltransferase